MSWVLAIGLLGQTAWLDDGPLGLADLAEYKAALDRPLGESAVSVTFRDLWDHPNRYRGRLVRVEGTIARHFGPTASGEFFAGRTDALSRLSELWIVSDAGDPLCLVYPFAGTKSLEARVRFEGTFLRRIRYRSGDCDRLAPLIVGRNTPTVVWAPTFSQELDIGRSRLDWGVGLTVGGIVAVILFTFHARRPMRRRIVTGPPPVFEEEIGTTDGRRGTRMGGEG